MQQPFLHCVKCYCCADNLTNISLSSSKEREEKKPGRGEKGGERTRRKHKVETVEDEEAHSLETLCIILCIKEYDLRLRTTQTRKSLS